MKKKLYDLLRGLKDSPDFSRDVEMYLTKGEIFDSLVIEFLPDKCILDWENWEVEAYDDVSILIASEKIIDIFLEKEKSITGKSIIDDVRGIIKYITKEKYSKSLKYKYLRMGENELTNEFVMEINFLESRGHILSDDLRSLLEGETDEVDI